MNLGLGLGLGDRLAVGGGGGGPSLPLDSVAGVVAAFALRKLRSAYSGPCVRVRRSADDVESDIGFSGGGLDTASLLAHCGAGNGFVVTLYDQSGNGNHATQATAASQPQAVTSGVLTATDDDGYPAMSLNGTSQFLAFNGAAAAVSGNDHANSLVLKLYGTSLASSYDPVSFSSSGNVNTRHHLRLIGTTGRFQVVRGDGTTPLTASGDGTLFTASTWLLWTQSFTGSAVSWWVNGAQDKSSGSLDVGTATFDRAYLGARDNSGTPNSHFPGRIASCIVFDSALADADRLALETAL